MANPLMLVNKRKRGAPKRRVRPPVKRKRYTRRTVKPKAATRRRRRNPIGSPIMNQMTNSAIGAGGALLTDLVVAKIPIPVDMTGTMGHVAKGGVSLAIGYAMAKFGKKRKLGYQLAEGGLTVAMHNMALEMVGGQLGLNGYNYGNPGDMSGYEDISGAGPDEMSGMGYANAAQMSEGTADFFSGYDSGGDDWDE